jgi:DNA modification methylase
VSQREFLNGRVTLMPGDCREVLATLPEASVDSVVCDPPYHLTSIVKRFGGENAAPVKVSEFYTENGKSKGSSPYKRSSAGFMGKQWDGGDVAFQVETWAAVFRVLKPGAHLLAFSGTRTYHRMVCAIEDAGFEIRDQIGWAYGSGFPKSHDVSKAIDRAAGAERQVLKIPRKWAGRDPNGTALGRMNDDAWEAKPDALLGVTAPATEAAKQWEGWGTALKPAYEPILVCSKPLTVYQFIAICIEALSMEMAECLSLPASDAERLFTDTRAKLQRVQADTVLARAKMRALESIETASFATQLSTCLSLEPSDPSETPGSSVRTAAKASGSRSTASAPAIPSGRVAASLSALTDITTSVLLGGTSASIVTSWSKFSDDALSDQSTYTIETAIRLIIGLRTLKSSLHQITSDDTGNFSPNWQPIVLARKPLTGTVAENVLRWGTGALNIDGCRVEGTPEPTRFDPAKHSHDGYRMTATGAETYAKAMGRSGEDSAERRYTESGSTNFAAMPGPRGGDAKGRWPANLVHDGSPEVMEAFPETGISTGGAAFVGARGGNVFQEKHGGTEKRDPGFGDAGSAARFFYTAKADQVDRLGSKHPTVKPLDLMQWLVRLVTPRGGTVLDPFSGTGTTGEAAWREGMRAILIERESEYIADIERRMELAANPTKRAAVAKTKNQLDDPNDLPLFKTEAAE